MQAPIKKITKRIATKPLPTLVDNPSLTRCKDLLQFTAGKALAITQEVREAGPDLVVVLYRIKLAATQGEHKLRLPEDAEPKLLEALRALGYHVDKDLVTYPGVFFGTRTQAYTAITW